MRRGNRGLAPIRGDGLLGPALATLADVQSGLTRGVPERARTLLRRLRDDRSLPADLRARAAADALDALWGCGGRAEALRRVRRMARGFPHPELTIRCANYAWTLGRRILPTATNDVASLLLAAEMDPEHSRARLEKVCRLAPRGDFTDLARYRLALFDYRSGRAPGRARRHVRDLLRRHPRSPLRTLARALLRGLARRAGPGRVRLAGFPAAVQRQDACVATALDQVRRYWSGAEARDPGGSALGIAFVDVPEAARRLGLDTRAVPLRPAALRHCLALGIPVLVPEDASGEAHLVTVVGYDPRARLAEAQDPAFLAPVEIPFAELRRSAARHGGIGLAAAPPGIDLPVYPDAEQALRLSGEVATLRLAGRIDEALARVRAARPARPGLEAELLLRAGRPQEALRVAQRWTRGGTPGYWGWRLLGDAAWIAGRREIAARAYRRALRHSPRDPAALCFLGEVLLEQGRSQAARRAFLAACDQQPTSPEAHERLRRVARAAGDARLAAEEAEWEARRK